MIPATAQGFFVLGFPILAVAALGILLAIWHSKGTGCTCPPAEVEGWGHRVGCPLYETQGQIIPVDLEAFDRAHLAYTEGRAFEWPTWPVVREKEGRTPQARRYAAKR